MKKHLIMLVVFLVPLFLLAQKNEKPYQYPMTKGSAAWDNLKTYKEKRDASQIPQQVVQDLTTSALLESVLNYPLLTDVMVFNSLQEGMDKLKTHFTAFNALLQRSDLPAVSIARYRKMPVDSVKFITTLIGKGGYSFRLNFMEMLLAQPELQGKLVVSDQKKLLQQLISNYDAKEKDPEVYGGVALSVTAWPAYHLSRRISGTNKRQADAAFDAGIIADQASWKSVINNARDISR